MDFQLLLKELPALPDAQLDRLARAIDSEFKLRKGKTLKQQLQGYREYDRVLICDPNDIFDGQEGRVTEIQRTTVLVKLASGPVARVKPKFLRMIETATQKVAA